MTLNSYRSLCDDLYIETYINTELDLPTSRDTILAFFERIRKQYPTMSCMYQRGKKDYCLEEDRTQCQYRWVALETDRIGTGIVNPPDFESAFEQNRLVLELAPYMLSVSDLDIESLDITLAMDFDCSGNHDEVITEALLSQSAFSSMLDINGSRAIGCSPAFVISLSSDDLTQGRISIESKTSIYGPKRREQLIDEAISLSFTVRQYPPLNQPFDPLKSFENQYQLAREIMAEKIVPNFVLPLNETIMQKRLT
jgi:hypothetical protein